MELANLVGVLAGGGGGSRLLPVFCKVSSHEKRAVGELVDVRRGRMAVVGGSAQGFRESTSVPRKDRWPDPCGAEFGGRGSFRVCNVVCFAPIAVAAGAPRVGDKAPEFMLADTSGKMVALSTLLSEPMPGMEGGKPRGVLLVFYRGYW